MLNACIRYRQEFRTDVVINLLGYRRYGHNELDQPSFTQPTLYSKIDKHPPVMDSTVANLVSTGKFEQEELDTMLQEVEALIEKSFDDAKAFVSPHRYGMRHLIHFLRMFRREAVFLTVFLTSFSRYSSLYRCALLTEVHG